MTQAIQGVPTRTSQPSLPHPPANGKDPSVSGHLQHLNRYLGQQQVAIDALYSKLAKRLNELIQTVSVVYDAGGAAHSVGANAAKSGTATVTGAVVGDTIQVTPSALETGLVPVSGKVTAADTVTLTVYNPTAAPIATGNQTWYVSVMRQ